MSSDIVKGLSAPTWAAWAWWKPAVAATGGSHTSETACLTETRAGVSIKNNARQDTAFLNCLIKMKLTCKYNSPTKNLCFNMTVDDAVLPDDIWIWD